MRDKKHLIAEAGTGTGKSIAYLIPAMHASEKVVISTNTKTLQDQLFEKDIPFLNNIFKRDIKIALAKGKQNYVCLRRYHHLRDRLRAGEDVDVSDVYRVSDDINGMFEKLDSVKSGEFQEFGDLHYETAIHAGCTDTCTGGFVFLQKRLL